MRREFTFLLALWKANLLSAMEYRASFISQTIGMALNNAVYFIFWVIFFDRFEKVQGWDLQDMFILFGVVAGGVGLGMYLFGNVRILAESIATGRLDYYLSLPRPVLLHAVASGSSSSGMGDFLYGILSFLVAGQYSPGAILRFIIGLLISMTIFVTFLILVQSLAFWVGNAQLLSQQAFNAVITFSLYPITLFDGTAKLFLLTVLPAALIGAVPAEFIASFSWSTLSQLLAGAGILLIFAVVVFYRGLRKYESGSAIQIQL